MRFETLRMIDSLLEDNVTRHQAALDIVLKNFKQVKQEQAKNPEQEDYFEESYQFWKDKKKTHYELLNKAENALAEFRSHKWS